MIKIMPDNPKKNTWQSSSWSVFLCTGYCHACFLDLRKDVIKHAGRLSNIFNRLCVAGAVLQTPLSLIHSFINDPYPPNLQNTITLKPLELWTWNFDTMFSTSLVSGFFLYNEIYAEWRGWVLGQHKGSLTYILWLVCWRGLLVRDHEIYAAKQQKSWMINAVIIYGPSILNIFQYL